MKRFIITSAQNDTQINENFLKALKNYSKRQKAKFIVLPTRLGLSEVMDFPKSLPVEFEDVELPGNVLLAGSILPLASSKNPLSGLKQSTGGQHVIIAGTQLQLQAKATGGLDSAPLWLMTSGSVTVPNYREGKTGWSAEFHHSYSAIVVEIDKSNSFHFRQVIADDTGGFYDIKGFYGSDGSFTKLASSLALVTGDVHALFEDESVTKATFTGAKSIVGVLKPETIIRHDLIDAKSISHHEKDNMLAQYKTALAGNDSLEMELEDAYDYIKRTTRKGSKNLIVTSNHDSHIDQWLSERAFRGSMKNLPIWHKLAYQKLSNPSMSALEIWMSERTDSYLDIEFIKENTSMKDIDIGYHGDRGLNGSRGSIVQFSRLDSKSIIGHTHTAGIEKGCYQVGTSTKDLSYAKGGLSTWSITHAVIYPNGKRTLINILDGSWKG